LHNRPKELEDYHFESKSLPVTKPQTSLLGLGLGLHIQNVYIAVLPAKLHNP